MALEEVAERQVVKRRRFTVEEYRKMGEAGIFSEDDRVELIDGGVVTMSYRMASCVVRETAY